jgi:hypothetical protein
MANGEWQIIFIRHSPFADSFQQGFLPIGFARKIGQN